MVNTETGLLIEVSYFNICRIDGKTRYEIMKLYPSRENGAYYIDKFSKYINDYYSLSLKDYCKFHLNIQWPKCPISNEEVGYRISGKGIKLSKFKKHCISKEHSPKFKQACEDFSKNRKGENNPMFGETPWNKGKDMRNPIIKANAERRRGIKTPEDVKKKQSEAAKKRKIHGHTGIKHSPKTRKRLREHTANLWATGVFSKVTSIHIKVREFLKTLNLKEEFIEEFQVKYFSMDFAFPISKIAIECQGTYFHIDPRVYPNGPIDAIQRRNFGRDKAKKKICEDKEGWKIIEIWETEINDNQFKEILKCKLLELNLLNH